MQRPIWKRLLLLVRVVLILAFISYLVYQNWLMVTHMVWFLGDGTYRSCVYRRRNYELESQSSLSYVTLQRHGRLGNWLFGYASLLGIAKANGYVPYFLSSHPLNYYFKLSKVRHEPAECLFKVKDHLPCTYTSDMMNLPAGNVTIDGYLQSWKYFRFIEDELRNEFKMSPQASRQAKALFNKHVGLYTAQGRLVISIHVRRGDFITSNLGFITPPKKYYENAMSYMLNRFPYSVFLVTSDDISWCSENLKPPRLADVLSFKSIERVQKENPKITADVLTERVPIVFSRAYTSWDDFSMLTLSNHSIMSVGTFSWWGAWFAGGHSVYYDGFPIPGSKIDSEMKKEDFYPSSWVALSEAVPQQPILHRTLLIPLTLLALSAKNFLTSSMS